MGSQPPEGNGALLAAVAGIGAGTRIAGYRVEEEIGRGGMAVVFRARDERLGRPVALKILAPALATAGLALERKRMSGRVKRSWRAWAGDRK